VLFFNPGSAGRRAAGHPLTVAILAIENGKLDWQFLDLDELWGKEYD
jgi:predicted phosphodiesterase